MIPIFDFDGTLVDSLEAHVRFYEDIAAEHGICLDPEITRRAIRDPGIIAGFFRKIGIPASLVPELLIEYKKRFKNYDQRVFPGIPELLQALKQREQRLSLATYNMRENVIAHGRDLLPFFDTIITQDDVPRKNQALKRIVDKYGLPPRDYVLIGDTCWDYASSQEAGIGFIGVSWGWHNLQPNSKYAVAQSVSELQEKLIS